MPTVETFEAYCNDIGAPEAARTRAVHLLRLSKEYLGRDPEFVILEDQITEEGVRQFFNVSGFWARGEYLDIAMPEPRQHFSISRIRNATTIACQDMKEIDFKAAKPDSKLWVRLISGEATHGIGLRATGKNCDYVLEAVRKYWLPLLEK